MATAFPGRDKFGPGRSNRFITQLGEMLIQRGGRRFYKVGAGPTWSESDRGATRAFQQAQGWGDADGLPGPRTWEYLTEKKGRDIPGASTAAAVAMGSSARIGSPAPGYPKGYAYGTKDDGYVAGYHTGQDWRAPLGAKVVAVRAGKIAKVVRDTKGYGNHIVLQADNGRDYWYCHLSGFSVSAAQHVHPGQQLGKVGSTGNSTGPHLHFEDRPRGGRYGQVRRPDW
jgi:murein DD-endopeptidase MepM/ murein hydrolase activator NlpD